jgi:AcrR family transcriptional regulator
MTRPSRPAESAARERLLQAGLEIARRQGIKALTVRAVATRAGANLGSFVYHFGTRDAFVDELVERWYAPMFEGLRVEAGRDDDALATLRRVLLQLAAWAVENRAFLAQLLLDAGAGEGGAQRFLRSLDARHPALLLQLIARAQQAGQLRRDEAAHQMLFMMTTLALPALLFQWVERLGTPAPALAGTLAGYATEPARLEARLDWALRGLAP